MVGTPFVESLVFVHGIMMASTWLSSSLYTMELVFAYSYFAQQKDQHRNFNWIVVGMLIADSVGTGALLANTYISVIFTTGQFTTHFAWPVPVLSCAKGVAGLLEHAFLIYRCWCLSNNNTAAIILSAMSIADATLFLISGISLAIHSELKSLPITKLSQLIGLCLNTATDLMIPAVLIWELRNLNSAYRSTKHLIRRLSISALTTGLGVGLVNVVGLILYLRSSSVYIIFLDALNRLYTLTVLFNLSFGMVQRSTQNSSFLHTVGDMNINNNIVLSSIHVQRSTRISTDGPPVRSPLGEELKVTDANASPESSMQDRKHDEELSGYLVHAC